ncbi:type II toxin-antitoxin system mRNA interferase toxin, RelE/StbE family [Candidatus Woesearchaeota archaeon]|nr:type II toxin-antitoxin system mRNA interferase toxin, RelE/StbE family [Candidatus Woesearchaeota archaeon]
MYSLDTKPKLDKIFTKLSRINPKQLQIILKKLEEILENPYRFKPLRGEMHGLYRVHIDKSFVLIYEIDEQNKTVILLDYDLHDKIYE